MRSIRFASALLMIAMTTACLRVDDTDLGYSDILTNAGAGDVPDAVRSANEVRESSVIFFFLERWLDRYENNDYVLVEAINEHDELHRFLLVVANVSAYELVTNIGLPPSVTGPLAPLPGDVLVYSVPANASRDQLFGVASQSVSGGVGGLADVDDGDSHFLTQSVSGALVKSVLYGVSFRPLDDDPDQPTDAADSQRYAATEAIYSFWADALAASPTPSVLITTTP